jgi:hypothetical protein
LQTHSKAGSEYFYFSLLQFSFWYHSIATIIETGKAHGAHSEDIYGCLYFFLSKQLRTLAHRLRKFSSSFTVLNFDARLLPQLIRDNVGGGLNLPSSIRFDRIEVSNILDFNYVGIHDVLTLWAPFLQESRKAAIIGYFMNWAVSGKSKLPGRACMAGKGVVEGLLSKVMAREEVRSYLIFSTKCALDSVKGHIDGEAQPQYVQLQYVSI